MSELSRSPLPGAPGTGVLVQPEPDRLVGLPGVVVPEPVAQYRPRRLGFMFWACVVWIGVVIVSAVTADLLPLYDPSRTGVGRPRMGPSLGHLLGTDQLGRDMLSRVVFGSRVSLIVGFTSIFIGLVVGGGLGLLAGYYRGVVESLIVGLSDAMLAFPALVFLIAIVTFLGHSITIVCVSIGVLAIAPSTRVVRASTLTFSQREFVLAARTLGAKSRRIVMREILPNVIPAALSFALIGVAVAIVAESTLSFLGLSIPPPTPTWGGMINEGRSVIKQSPHVTLIPCAVMFLTVLALNFAGDSLRTRFDVREGGL